MKEEHKQFNDGEGNHPYEDCAVRQDLSEGITVENLSDAIAGAYAIGYPIALSARGVTDSQGFIAYNEGEFIMMAYDMLAKSLDDCIILKEYRDLSEKEILNIMREQYPWCEDTTTVEEFRELESDVPAETFVNVTQCDFGKEPEIFREQVKPMEEIGDPRDVRWQAARILVLAGYRGYKSFYVDQGGDYRLSPSVGLSLNVDATEAIELLNGTSNGLCQVVSLESYIRNPANGITLWENARIENPYRGDDPDAITLEVIHKHRVLLLWRCLEMMTEPYESDETKFKRLCIKIKTTFECEGYCLDTSTFSPYYNMPQLVGIVEMVVQHSGQSFTIQPALGGQIDMESVMRAFVTKYSTEQYLPEIYVVK